MSSGLDTRPPSRLYSCRVVDGLGRAFSPEAARPQKKSPEIARRQPRGSCTVQKNNPTGAFRQVRRGGNVSLTSTTNARGSSFLFGRVVELQLHSRPPTSFAAARRSLLPGGLF